MGARDILKETETKMKKAQESARRNFLEIRTGRANPHMVEGLHVEYYGTPTVLKQLANIAVPDARLIVIHPWDNSIIPEVEKAIQKSNLGITPSNDGKVIRLPIPQLTEERREELKKIVKGMAEEARISLRTIRRDANDAIKKMESDKVISEDDRFKTQADVQKITDRYIKAVDDLLHEKEKELTEF